MKCEDCIHYKDENTTKWCNNLDIIVSSKWFCADFKVLDVIY